MKTKTILYSFLEKRSLRTSPICQFMPAGLMPVKEALIKLLSIVAVCTNDKDSGNIETSSVHITGSNSCDIYRK